ncbi:uncharacterized protein FIBRA_05127 [Fibroporia radiculosa]|uniref:Uncharacterized protein n=1 Tax=Fibroporia radiculosa TaxID=599839 RepID=J4GQF6_9APHY|nr:uncharacterized protein FIBRA_05127 [Fibroporia radiculosa]CCM03010.1 predicted protein [Fibroporia radiculosa]
MSSGWLTAAIFVPILAVAVLVVLVIVVIRRRQARPLDVEGRLDHHPGRDKAVLATFGVEQPLLFVSDRPQTPDQGVEQEKSPYFPNESEVPELSTQVSTERRQTLFQPNRLVRQSVDAALPAVRPSPLRQFAIPSSSTSTQFDSTSGSDRKDSHSMFFKQFIPKFIRNDQDGQKQPPSHLFDRTPDDPASVHGHPPLAAPVHLDSEPNMQDSSQADIPPADTSDCPPTSLPFSNPWHSGDDRRDSVRQSAFPPGTTQTAARPISMMTTSETPWVPSIMARSSPWRNLLNVVIPLNGIDHDRLESPQVEVQKHAAFREAPAVSGPAPERQNDISFPRPLPIPQSPPIA